MSEMILKEPLTIDITELHIDRFKNQENTAYETSVV
jgi:hypothetical protein